jgi:hypothetical protein
VESAGIGSSANDRSAFAPQEKLTTAMISRWRNVERGMESPLVDAGRDASVAEMQQDIQH